MLGVYKSCQKDGPCSAGGQSTEVVEAEDSHGHEMK